MATFSLTSSYYSLIIDSDVDNSKCEWGEWSRGACSVSCGGGFRIKTQLWQPKEGNVEECSGYASEYEDCNTNECPVCKTNPCPGIDINL